MSKENGVTYYTFETSQGTKKYTSDEIINDKNFFLPKQQYDNYSNGSYLNASAKINTLLKGKPQFHTEKNINGKIYTVADYENKKDEIKASIMKSPLFTAILKDPTFDAEAYYEDTLQKVTYNEKGERVNNDPFIGSDEQMEEIRQSIAQNLITDAQSQGDALAQVQVQKSGGNVPKYILDAQDLATRRSEQGTNLNNLLNSFNSNPNQLGTGIFNELTSNPTAYGIPDFYKNYTTDKNLAKTEIEQLKESETIREDQYKKFVEQIEKAPEGTLFSFDVDDLKKKRNPILDQKQTAIKLLNEAAIFENLTTQEIDGIVRKWFDNNPIQKYLNPFVYGPKNK